MISRWDDDFQGLLRGTNNSVSLYFKAVVSILDRFGTSIVGYLLHRFVEPLIIQTKDSQRIIPVIQLFLAWQSLC